MYTNNIMNFQEFTTILNAHSKKVWKLIVCTSYVHHKLRSFEVYTSYASTNIFAQSLHVMLQQTFWLKVSMVIYFLKWISDVFFQITNIFWFSTIKFVRENTQKEKKNPLELCVCERVG